MAMINWAVLSYIVAKFVSRMLVTRVISELIVGADDRSAGWFTTDKTKSVASDPIWRNKIRFILRYILVP